MEEKEVANRKNNKKRRETAVQGTNDSSIVSKCSMASCGYYDDPFLHYFVSKLSRRAPLIHRGYYIRAAAFDKVLRNFLEQFGGTKNQIISLGCGFDSAYFRLKADHMLENTTFVEIDFPELVCRKRLLIENTESLSVLVERTDSKPLSPHIEFCCSDYYLLGVDLTQVNTLEAALKMCSLDFESPTLLFSECVLTYMTRRCSTDLVKWAAETFEHAIFTIYEQINPDDAFGLFMQNHFHSIGSPLKCINSFPTLQSQIKRFQDTGWVWCEALDMNTFYYHCVPSSEQQRVEGLETFDEYEELNLKYSHYFILTASTIPRSDSLIFQGAPVQDPELPPAIPDMIVMTRPSLEEQSVRRFGHSTSLICDRYAVTSGGFGAIDGRHQRLAEITVTDIETCVSHHIFCSCPDTQYSRMHHASVSVSDGSIYLIGGRQSPYFMCNQMLKIRISVEARSSSIDGMEPSLEQVVLKHSDLNCAQNYCCSSSISHRTTVSDLTDSDKKLGIRVCKQQESDENKCVTSAEHKQCVFSSEQYSKSNKEHAPEGASKTNHTSSLSQATCDLPLEDSRGRKETNVKYENPPASFKHIDGTYDISACSEHQVQSWKFALGEVDVVVVPQTGTVPQERWRHAAVVVQFGGKEQVFMHGGKNKNGSVMEDCFLFDVATNSWEKLMCSGPSPGARHSHCVNFWKDHVVVTGGLDSAHMPVRTVHLLNLASRTWEKLTVEGNLHPRYSHTGHVFGDKLVLVGGVNLSHPPPGVAVLNLQTRHALEFAFPAQDKANLLMFHRHSSLRLSQTHIMVFGGGGNCFSFGTHLNRTPLMLDLAQCLNALD